MSIFAHVSVFLSIILGLAVVHLLGGISLMLDTRIKTKLYWVHLVWTINMLFIVILVWLSGFVLSPLTEMGALHFLNLLVYSIVAYLMSGLLFPVRGEEITDFREHFNANQFRLYVLGIIFTLVDATDGIIEHYAAGIEWDIGQFATLSVWLIVFTIGLWVKSERYSAFAALVLLVGILGWFQSLIDTSVLAW